VSSPKEIALYSIIANGLRVAVGPITILIVASSLSKEELGFYYVFFSIFALQQLLEMGFGNVLRQYVAHSPMKSEKGEFSKADYYKFSQQWYRLLSIVVFLFVGLSGLIYFKDYAGPIDWEYPWLFFVLFSCLQLSFQYKVIFLDAIQHQVCSRKIQIIASLTNAIVLWVCLLNGFGLLSICVGLFFSIILQLVYIYTKIDTLYLYRNLETKSFKCMFFEIRGLLGRTSIVWIFNYLVFNGFSLISFKALGPASAGIIGLSVSLLRAVADISSSAIIGQMSLYSDLIYNGKIRNALNEFKRYASLGVLIYALSVMLIALIKIYFDSLDTVLNKVLDIVSLVNLMFFFGCFVISTMFSNFVRCYKVEPFIFVSIWNGCLIPITFIISIEMGWGYFLLPSLVIFISTLYVIKIWYKYNQVGLRLNGI